jgi:NAD dependent epimerase/dehydratase family enzyme
MDNKKVLIAGGSGFIGQKLASLLIDKGFDVSTLTRKPKNSKDIFWNPKKKEINLSQLSEIDVLVNLVGENIGYSKYAYSIPAATANNVVYPSLDPSIFEVKYPNQDIQGRVVPL